MEFIANYTNMEVGVFTLLVTYGIMFGVTNTFNRIRSIIFNQKLIQSDLGRLLDAAFYAGILYLILK